MKKISNSIIITLTIALFCAFTAQASSDTDSVYMITKDGVRHVYVLDDLVKKGKDSFSFKNEDGKMYAASEIVAYSYDAAKKKNKVLIVEYRKIGINWSYKIVSGWINIYKYGESYSSGTGSRSRFTYHIQKGDLEEPVELKQSGVYYKSGQYINDEIYNMFSDYEPAKAIIESCIDKKKYISMDAITEAAKVYNNQ